MSFLQSVEKIATTGGLYLYNRSVGLRVSSGDAVDGLAWLSLVINGSLRLSLCWSCSILLCRLGLHCHRLLSSGVPESGVALLALYLRGRLSWYRRQDCYTGVLGCYSRLHVLLVAASCEVSGGDVMREIRNWSCLRSGGWRVESNVWDILLGRCLFVSEGGLNWRGRQQYLSCVGVGGIHKGLDGISRRICNEPGAGAVRQRGVVCHRL